MTVTLLDNARTARALFLCLLLLAMAGCKLHIVVPAGGEVLSQSGEYRCQAGQTCPIEVLDLFFDETFEAVPAEGYDFERWLNRERGFCGGNSDSCRLVTSGFAGNDILLSFLASDIVFFLQPIFRLTDPNVAQRIGFEVIELQSPTSLRAWISPQMTADEFDALELPNGWIKNQPREGDPDTGRFLRSPDEEEEGVLTIDQFFGYQWFHSATVVETGIPVDEEGLLSATRVRKYHELTFYAGSTLVLLISPDNEVYFRIGRDARRASDNPSVPNLWRLEEYTTPRDLVISLDEGNIVLRTDNKDSFQGPVAELADVI